MKQTWTCWWYLQWSYALADRRQALWAAEATLESAHSGFTGTIADDKEYWRRRVLRAERRVNKALAKRAKWKARGACENCRRAAARLEA